MEYSFRETDILIRALTHKSHPADQTTVEPAAKTTESDNEQLEFFGDAILGFLVSEALFARFPAYPEGKLSKLKSWLVSASHLHTVAEGLRLGEALRLGRGEEMSGGRRKKAILANALEAVLAAVYLDGGMDGAREFVRRWVLPQGSWDFEVSLPVALTDFKSALQEKAQASGLPQPKYVIVGERGPEHAKTFLVEVRLGKEQSTRAEGISKKDAGQKAAELMLERIGGEESYRKGGEGR
ncbi:MAG: ribonuclease III [Bryobacterales bacterium]|nr:ribonuclease III [Bryobacterales bacterium]